MTPEYGLRLQKHGGEGTGAEEGAGDLEARGAAGVRGHSAGGHGAVWKSVTGFSIGSMEE